MINCDKCYWVSVSLKVPNNRYTCLHPSNGVRNEFYKSTPPNYSRSPMREFCCGYVVWSKEPDLTQFTDITEDCQDGIPF